MKKLIFIITIFVLSSFFLLSDPYHYHRGEKVYLEEISNQIFVKLAPNIHKEQFFSAIDVDILSQLKYDTSLFNWAGYISSWVFESKENVIFPPNLQNHNFLSKFYYIGN